MNDSATQSGILLSHESSSEYDPGQFLSAAE